MNVSLYQAASAMNANARWQEVLAENLAASSQPGAQRREISFSAVEAGVARVGVGGANQRFVIASPQTVVSMQQGPLHPSGGKTDMALEGPGFFEVRLANGGKGYTRDGEFHFNAAGQLVTKLGFPVMGEGGPLALDPQKLSRLSVAATGEVSQDGEVKGRLRATEFADPSAMQSIGGGYYITGHPDVEPLPSSTTQIRQGFIEGANISPTMEMATMLTAMRMFEASQHVMQAQDERMGRVISELGNPS